MFQVSDVYDEVEDIAGFCNESRMFLWITNAISLIANKSDFDGWIQYVDLCVSGQCITLPREVVQVLGINIEGTPTLGRNQLFNFHLNGPGDGSETIQYTHQDLGTYPVYRDIAEPVQLIAFVDKSSDAGKQLRVYGFDENGIEIRQQVGGVWQDGWLIPTVFGIAVPDVNMPLFSRITRVVKAVTDGNIRLSTIDSAGTTGVNLGVYESDETEPRYRRIKLGKTASWVRVAYRKASPKITSKSDRIPLHSSQALLFAVHALKFYREHDLATAHAYEADAVRLEKEASDVAEHPAMGPLNVVDIGNNLNEQSGDDWDIT
jgi:hypothetical protein